MNIFTNSIPQSKPSDIIAWADATLKVDGHSFDSSRTPQLIEPIRAMADLDTRIGTLIKPVQVGGSTAGEVVLAYWAAFENGLIQFNWENDQKAVNRWNDRIMPALESCLDIKRTGGRFEELICEARYVNTTIRCQGVFKEDALDSDTIPFQLNEELHSWKPGFLSKARRRQTQVWNAKAFDISNAGNIGDQLHSAFESGTSEVWEVHCPKCCGWHEMRFRWNPDKPELGGLRWDSDGCKMDGGRFNYNKLERTIRYQMPCGHEIRDHASERRLLKGRYRVTNEGAHISHRSWNFEGVSCDAIRWLSLIQEWHAAIRAQRVGDIEPMRRFVTERECRFWSSDMMPFHGAILLNQAAKKSRAGLAGKAVRLWAADRQKGYRAKGEMPHYWLVIRDVMPNADSMLVFEGLVQTEADLAARLAEHSCNPICGCIDATWDRDNILALCYRSGYNATTGSAQRDYFAVKDDNGNRVRRVWSEPEGIHKLLNTPPRFNYRQCFNPKDKTITYLPDPSEPRHWSYHKIGLFNLLLFLRNSVTLAGDFGIKWEIPGDVSDDYQKHLQSWEYATVQQGKSGQTVEQWRQTSAADHMLLCEAYIAGMIAMSGILGRRLAIMGVSDTLLGSNEPTSTKTNQ